MDVPHGEVSIRLEALLTDVEHGEQVTITRDGRPVALLVPVEAAFDVEEARRAAAGLREASRGLSLGGLSVRELIAEGRR